MRKLKRILIFAALVAALTCLLCMALNAETYSGTCGAEGDGSNLTWTLDSDGLLKISGSGAMADYSYSGNAPWYNNRSSIKMVVINDGVASIGSYAFYRCTRITNITISLNVTNIGYGAFGGCVNLNDINISEANLNYKLIDGILFTADEKKLIICPVKICGATYTVPNGVTSIGEYAFQSCTSLTNVTIPNSVTVIGANAFSGCKGLTSITIPNSVISIEKAAFSNCMNLTDIAMSNSITSIGNFAFSNCGNLASIAIPDSVTAIGNYAFSGCGSLTSITVPNSVTVLGNHVFENCTRLTSVTLPDGMISIGTNMFYACRALTNVAIPSSVTSIGDYAFSQCDSLANIIIPDSVASIGSYAFQGCISLVSIAIPNGVTSIGNFAFSSCRKLMSIDIPNGVTNIGVGVFDCCSSITSIVIPSSVTSIERSLFHGCSSLTNVEIPSSVTSIGEGAFQYCNSLTSIEIPISVTSIGNNTFGWCGGLKDIKFYSDTVEIGDSEETIPSSAIIYGYKGSTAEKYATNYDRKFVALKNLMNIIASGTCGAEGDNLTWTLDSNGLLKISGEGDMANFTGSSSTPWREYRLKIKAVEMDDGVTSVGHNVFRFCYYIERVVLPSNLKSIGMFAFSHCRNLTSIEIPSSVTNIYGLAFAYCDNLTNIFVEDGNTVYHSADNCVILTEEKTLVLGCNGSIIPTDGSVTSIGAYSFCGNICREDIAMSINIPYCITKIGASAFAYCTSVAEVSIPESTVEIPDAIFRGCEKLTSINVDEANPNYKSIDGVLFTKDGKTLINYPAGKSGEPYTIPEEVTSICSLAFERALITGVIIPDGVTDIGESTFMSCRNLMSVTIPEGVTGIGRSTFSGCTSLESVTIPVSVTSIGTGAFSGCNNLTSIKIYSKTVAIEDNVYAIPSSATIYGYNGSTAEEYATKYERTFVALAEEEEPSIVANGTCGINGDNVTWTLDSDGLLKISDTGAMADYDWENVAPWYEYRSSITEVEIAEGVTSIGNDAFDYCEKLTSVTIPNSVTSIGESAFFRCDKLSSIVIPNSVVKIGNSAFAYCTSLTEVSIPAGTTDISGAVFRGCEKLTSINVDEANPNYKSIDGVLFTKDGKTLMNYPAGKGEEPYIVPNGVISILGSAFERCKFSGITLPASLTDIGYADIFPSSIKNISVDAANPNYKSVDGVLFTKDGKSLIKYPAKKSGETYTVPDGVVTIRRDAFEYCMNLKNITMPNGVKSIRYGAFRSCRNLENINIPDGVTLIDSQAFLNCSSLKSITIPISVTEIEHNAFAYCENLESITIYSKSAMIFENPNTIPASATIYGGKGSTAEEYATKYGRTFKEIDIPTVEIARGTCGENLTWVLDSDGLLKISGTGAMADYDWENNAPWYEYRSNITKSEIQNGVTSIGNWAFEGCYSLKNISMSESVTSIGSSAFNGCRNLTDITISANVTSIGQGAFYNCSKLASISVNEANANYRFIDGVLFSKDGKTLIQYPSGKSAEEYTVPDGVTSIGSWAFGYCTRLTSINMPDSVTSIGESAFFGCQNLVNVNIPNGVTAIELQTFWECSSLTSITIPDSVASIGNSAFLGCKNLVSVNIPNGVTAIGWRTFLDCISLESITIPASVTEIGNDAFYGCSSLTSITIYSKTAWIADNSDTISESATIYGGKGSIAEEYATKYGRKFVEIEIPTVDIAKGTCGENLTWVLDSDGLLKISGTGAMADYKWLFDVPWSSYASGITTVEISDGVTSIGRLAFFRCTSLASITIPDSVTSIGNDAFANSGITSITIPNGVTSIGNSAFENCTSLESIEIPDGVTSIGSSAFASCEKLKSITLPSGLTSIKFGVFRNCTALESIIIPARVMEINGAAFVNCNSLTSITIYSKKARISDSSDTIPESATIYGGKGSTAEEYATKYGRTFKEIEIPTVEIANGTCGENITWVLDSDGLLKISGTGTMTDYLLNENAPWYSYNSSIMVVDIADGVTSIGAYAFVNCENIANVTISGSVTSIGEGAFLGCAGLANIIIPESVTEIGDMAFGACAALSEVSIPAGVTNIGKGPFYACLNLTNINVDEANPNYKSVGGVLFTKDGKTLVQYPIGIKADTYEVPSGVTEIRGMAFAFGKFSTVKLPVSIETIGDVAFGGCANLVGINLPSGITRIGDRAFMLCSKLGKIAIPGGVTYICQSAFAYCIGLTSINIPAKVTFIGEQAFFNCNGLTAITVDEANENYKSVDGVLFTKDGKKLIQYPVSNERKSYAIPVGVTSIEYAAFCGSKNLIEVTIPEGVEIIAEGAFNSCPNIKIIILPASVTSIGDFAFYGCPSLKSVRILSKTAKFPEYRFVFDEVTTVYGYEGSTAEEYAKKYNLSFASILSAAVGADDTNVSGSEVTIDTTKEIVDNKENQITIKQEVGEKLDGKESANVKTNVADIAFDKTATEKIAESAKKGDINLVIKDITEDSQKNKKKIIEISLTDSDGNRILPDNSSEENGYITVSILFKAGMDKSDIEVIYKGENGEEKMEIVSYDSEMGIVTFKTKHFSEYEIRDTSFKLGDINGDGKIDVKDLVTLRRYMAAYEVDSFDKLAADINGDGKINTTDLVLIRRYLAGISGTGIE